MAKATPILWPHKTDAAGHRPLWLRFEGENRTLYTSLGVRLHPRFWNETTGRVRKGHPHADRINALIARRLSEVEDERLRLLAEREPVTAAALKAAVQPRRPAAEEACFLRYVETFLEGVERAGNVARVKRERVVLSKLRAFAGAPLPFSRFTSQFLRDFEAHCLTAHGNKASTALANTTIVRIHLRRAMKEGVMPREADPFFAYTPVKAVKPERLKLTERELAAIEALDLGPGGPSGALIARVRDAFLFSLYAAGVRFGDLARLRCGDVREVDGAALGVDVPAALRVVYTAGKTGKRGGVILVPQALRIARPYLDGLDVSGTLRPRAAGEYLFPILDGYDLSTPRKVHAALSAQNALHNKYLREIAERAGIRAGLSFHVSRHSFADLARRRGWNVYDISKALQHSGLAVTERYLAGFDADALDGRMGELFGEERT